MCISKQSNLSYFAAQQYSWPSSITLGWMILSIKSIQEQRKELVPEVNNNQIITNLCKFCILEETNKQWIISSNLYIQNLKPQQMNRGMSMIRYLWTYTKNIKVHIHVYICVCIRMYTYKEQKGSIIYDQIKRKDATSKRKMQNKIVLITWYKIY